MTVLHKPTGIFCCILGFYWDYMLIKDETGNEKYIDPLDAYKEGYEIE